jgi:hypothetical protein
MWGPGAAGGFQNALSTGLQLGQMARQQKQQNALMQQRQAQIDLQGRQFEAEQGQRAADARRADLPTVIRLLETSTDEQTYQRNLGLAGRFGIDTSQLPQTFDPAWRDNELKSMKAIATPEGQAVLSASGKQAADEGLTPGTPEFQARAREVWEQSGAIPYTGENGETRLYVPGRGVPTREPVGEGTVIENGAGEQMILRNGRWVAMPKGGAGGNVSGNF